MRNFNIGTCKMRTEDIEIAKDIGELCCKLESYKTHFDDHGFFCAEIHEPKVVIEFILEQLNTYRKLLIFKDSLRGIEHA